MNISIEKRQAYSEVLQILNMLDETLLKKVPNKLIEFFKNEKDISYKKDINVNIPLNQQNLKRETFVILAILNLKYWSDKQEKKKLEEQYMQNEEIYQNKLQSQYSVEKIFKNFNTPEKLKPQVPATIEKQTILKKILKFFSKFFSKK